MRLISVTVCALLLAGCQDRFNWHDKLKEEPSPSEVVGTYELNQIDDAAVPLVEMGYKDIEGVIELREDGTYRATGVPGCCVHGWDERTYPFTGGSYSFAGGWSIQKSEAVYEVVLRVESITELSGLTIADPELAQERTPSAELNLTLIRGDPLDVGFDLYNGDFWPVRFTRTEETKNAKPDRNGD